MPMSEQGGFGAQGGRFSGLFSHDAADAAMSFMSSAALFAASIILSESVDVDAGAGLGWFSCVHFMPHVAMAGGHFA